MITHPWKPKFIKIFNIPHPEETAKHRNSRWQDSLAKTIDLFLLSSQWDQQQTLNMLEQLSRIIRSKILLKKEEEVSHHNHTERMRVQSVFLTQNHHSTDQKVKERMEENKLFRRTLSQVQKHSLIEYQVKNFLLERKSKLKLPKLEDEALRDHQNHHWRTSTQPTTTQ